MNYHLMVKELPMSWVHNMIIYLEFLVKHNFVSLIEINGSPNGRKNNF